MTGGTLRAYGHSWVAGEGASDTSRGLVEVAAAQLGLTADNRGVGGSHAVDTASQVGRDAPTDVALHVVLTGLNDARQHGADEAALGSYAAALVGIFRALLRPGLDRVVVAVEQPPLADYTLHPPHHRGSNEVLNLYNQRLHSVARGYSGVVVAPVTGWDAHRMLTDDTVHPNDAGHECVARAVVAAGRALHHPGAAATPR